MKNIFGGYQYFLKINIIFFLVPPCGMWDPSSPTKDLTHTPCSEGAES